MSKKKSKLVMPPKEAKQTDTLTPDGQEHEKLVHQEVNFGNVQALTLQILSNMNKNTLYCYKELKEIKELLRASNK